MTEKTLQEMLGLEQQIQIMDVGASAINEVPAYNSLLDLGLGHLHAFEGDQRQVEKIKHTYGNKCTVYDEFLFDGEVHPLYICAPESGMTSLFRPKKEALQFFNGFDRFGQVEQTQAVQTVTMNSVTHLPSIDFLKMDIQGAELTALQNGIEKLKHCVAIQLEVSYVCLYEQQPSFGQVDVWMRSQGYVPHCFLEVKRWSIAPTVFDNNFRMPGNQLLESDIVYVKDPLNLHALSVLELKKLTALAHYAFKSMDLCVHLLLALEARGALVANTHLNYLNWANRL